ncbi:methyltransferase family protein [Thauera sp. Sel9]|uniref:methyltransferase family protein n=1 Tax=Thauera sp. Sel9 TaxID=2974299 RepID=UPI0021E19819|nr:isoprenylcysteine carboxylmethyltransferase family protein [Thauera sp. Sel9]MCV2217142.1 isoprenylcysteine carboxylmethyltransferase family protein [Thauera sp. Sel9]
MQWLETKIPPPVVMVLLGAVVYGVAPLLPELSFEFALRTTLAIALVLVGLALNILPALAFLRAGTTFNPLRPASATSLVTSGIYRHTRNPMYLGDSVILLGWALYLGNAAAFVAVPAFMLYITRFQIQPEERHLSARFPEAYASFCKRTPRWL